MSLSNTLLDTQGRVTEVRFWLGDISTAELSDSVIERFLLRNEDLLTADLSAQCEVIFRTLIDTLTYLVRRADADQADTRGLVSERSERIGGVSISVKTNTTSGTTQNGWERLLEDYLNDPSLICNELATRNNLSTIILGGTSIRERDRINSNQDNESVFDHASPYTPAQNDILLTRQNIFQFRRSRYPTRRNRY